MTLTRFFWGDYVRLDWLLLKFSCVLALSLFPVSWNGTSVTYFGFSLVLCGGTREVSTASLLSEFSSWAWLFFAIFYLWPHLTYRLSESFTVNNLLWIRFLPCMPYEIAFARGILIILWCLIIGLLWGAWAVICSIYHGIPIEELLLNAEGVIGHILISTGIVLAFNWRLPLKPIERNQVTFLAFTSPLILTLAYLGLNRILDHKWMQLFPFVIPFNNGLSDVGLHSTSVCVLGFTLILIHILSKLQLFCIAPLGRK
jgi:hypothetical protein